MAIFSGIIVGLGITILLFKLFFDDWDEVWQSIVSWLGPDTNATLEGRWDEYIWLELKLVIWLALGAASGFAAYTGVMKLFPGGE